MSLITIIRIKHLPDRELGEIELEGDLIGYTIEQPWKENKNNVSCIPVGSYKLLPHNSPHFGSVVMFYNPELGVYGEQLPPGRHGRTVCLIHNGNYVTDVQGCVAVGAQMVDFGSPHGLGVNHSKDTLEKLRELWGDRKDLRAIIRNA